jgi:8-oxo-dGTP pyrophosphatase MutT (NUDIX family)
VTTEEATPREAARVLLFDRRNRILLLKGHDPFLPERAWWFTPGGGLHPGETPRAGAAREAREETGYDIPEEALIGPVWERTAVFDFMNCPYVQHEHFFLARVADAVARPEAVWTEAEHATIDAVTWHTIDEVRSLDIDVFPLALGDLLTTVLPWDGVLRNLGTEQA